jgi:UDP-glucose 4-epimerase
VRVLVTGGAGFIGSHVVEALRRAGHEVAVLDNLSRGRRENLPAAVKIYQVDLRDRNATLRALSEFGPSAVSHQAAQASVPVSLREPHLDAEVSVLGGLNLLDACVRSDVKRVVFASTGGAIYGEVPEGVRAVETRAANPQSPYAIHKLCFEQLLRVFEQQHGLETTTLRYANVYGPRQDPLGEGGVVAIFLASALRGREIRVNARERTGDAGCVRDYVFVGDVARANALAIDGGMREPVLNVGTGVGTTTLELAERTLALTQRRVAIEHAPPRAGDLRRSVLDPALAEHRLGPLTSLDQGLAETAAWFRSRS